MSYQIPFFRLLVPVDFSRNWAEGSFADFGELKAVAIDDLFLNFGAEEEKVQDLIQAGFADVEPASDLFEI